MLFHNIAGNVPPQYCHTIYPQLLMAMNFDCTILSMVTQYSYSIQMSLQKLTLELFGRLNPRSIALSIETTIVAISSLLSAASCNQLII